jgi:hypothetical protein
MNDRIPDPDDFPEIRRRALAYIGACLRVRTDFRALPGLDMAQEALRTLLSGSGACAPHGWTDEITDTLLDVCLAAAGQFFGELADLERRVERLPGPPGGPAEIPPAGTTPAKPKATRRGGQVKDLTPAEQQAVQDHREHPHIPLSDLAREHNIELGALETLLERVRGRERRAKRRAKRDPRGPAE